MGSTSMRVTMSHPVWVRGLKPFGNHLIHPVGNVAPRVGAWIETLRFYMLMSGQVSHPVWVRGLKRKINVIRFHFLHVAPRVGAWIETFL